jgi:glycerol-3-phosphate dehydrogenase (NAD(P)+)
MNITILGAGAWGTALGIALAECHAVTLWVRDAVQRAALASGRRSRYLSEVPVPAAVAIADDALAAIRACDLVLVATPSAGLRAAAGLARDAGGGAPVVWACKGFEPASAKLPHQVVAETLRPGARSRARALRWRWRAACRPRSRSPPPTPASRATSRARFTSRGFASTTRTTSRAWRSAAR